LFFVKTEIVEYLLYKNKYFVDKRKKKLENKLNSLKKKKKLEAGVLNIPAVLDNRNKKLKSELYFIYNFV
jgi:hypothetical protein